MDGNDVDFGRFLGRITACHVTTYFVAGLFASTLMDYKTLFQSDNLACYMLPTSSPWVAAGPALQIIRGLIFALALYPFRRVFLGGPRGALKLFSLLLGLAILSTAGPAPGSIEGMIYTKLPVVGQITGLWETVFQLLAFSFLVVAWHRKPTRAWSVAMGTLTALVILMSLAGVFLPH